MDRLASPPRQRRDAVSERTAPRPSGLRESWREAWATPRFRLDLVVTLPFLTGVLIAISRVLLVVEARAGVVLPDPVLDSIGPVDLTWGIFAATYGGLVLGILVLTSRPRILLDAARAYALVCLFRMATMLLVPLEPPAGHLPLTDPIIEGASGAAETLTKDLLFSGHTAVAFLLFLAMPGRGWRAVFLGITIAVGSGVIAQHVHYTIDVVLAPFVAYACWRIAPRLSWSRGGAG